MMYAIKTDGRRVFFTLARGTRVTLAPGETWDQCDNCGADLGDSHMWEDRRGTIDGYALIRCSECGATFPATEWREGS